MPELGYMSRVEVKRLLTGAGRFVNDPVAQGTACLFFLRSPHARVRIVSIDCAPARADNFLVIDQHCNAPDQSMARQQRIDRNQGCVP